MGSSQFFTVIILLSAVSPLMGSSQFFTGIILLSAVSPLDSPGSSDWTRLKCSDVTTLPAEREVSPEPGEIVQVKYSVEKGERLWCHESVELRVSALENVPERLTWVRVLIKEDLTLDLLEGHNTTHDLRDGIRISKDAILAMYLLKPVLRPLNLTFTLKFEVNSSVEVNVTVESKVDGRYVNTDNKSLTLNIPDLNLTSKVGLRTELVREEGGDWVPNKMCTERVQKVMKLEGQKEKL
ncbi:hypothetical protein ACHWQZ_G012900 [Mnemiopsis leidyi]